MTEIVLFANDEVLELVKAPTISSGDVNCVSLTVDFSKEWDGFTKVAVLFNGDFSPESNYEKVLTNGKCTVPGEVLKGAEPFYIGIKGIKTDATKTTTILKYQVIKGVPTVITEITEDVYQQILAAYANLETIRNEVDADAKQTAADRAEVKKMVESVAGIDEQVAKVEQLSQQAQESARQAGTSATAAEQAKTQAETAKLVAETAAGMTAEDRTAVNQAKTAVEEAQKAVKANRTAVEEVKQSVEQLGNAIPEATQAGVQAVDQAKQTAVDEITQTGTAHKTAVEGAGIKAVQAVENVKQAAEKAVETAKNEAVQAVQTEGTKQTGNVTAEGAKQVKTITDTGTQQTQAVTAEGQKQLTAVQQAAQEIVSDRAQIQTNKADIVNLKQNKAGAIVENAKGKKIVLDDSSELFFDTFCIFGESKQDGVPALDNPKEIISKEIREVKVTGKNLLDFKTVKILNSVIKPEMLDNGFVLNATDANDRIIYCECNLKAGKTYVLSYKSNKISGSANAKVSNHFPKINQYFKSGKPVVPNRDVSKTGFYIDMENVPTKFVITDVQVEEGTTVTVYEPYSEQIITLAEPIILNGLKVNSGGNYKDSNGQQWICDEIDFKRGKYVQRILKTKPKKPVVFQSRDDNTGRCVVFDENLFGVSFKTGEVPALSTFALYSEWANYMECTFALSGVGFYYKDITKTLEEINAIFEKLGTNFEICGVLETPIEHDLPLEIIEAYKELHTNYPTTVITNDAGADMEVSYVADTKLYIDNKLKELVTANQADTANLLSLMPMETQAAMIENDTNRILESEVTQ